VPELELPIPDDQRDEKLLSGVRTFGWSVLHIDDGNHPEHAEQNAALGPHAIYDAAFSYTIGLSMTREHPEIVLVGRWTHNHAILTSAVAQIDNGHRFQVGSVSDEVVQNYEVCFGAVSPARRDELLTYATWLNQGRPFDAVQLVLPDREGRWPWDDGYDSVPQPLLDGSI
jgi:hypothetical protein